MFKTILSVMVGICSYVSLTAQLSVGLTLYSEEAMSAYTLVAPMNSLKTYLINNCGEVVHEWQSEYNPGFGVHFLPDGKLLRTLRLASSPVLHGSGGGIEIRDWNNNLIWSYIISDSTRTMHHDVKMMPNGNILVLVAESTPMQEAYQMGRDSTKLFADLWSDAIYELRPFGEDQAEIVWEWRAWDHIIQDKDPGIPNYGIIANNPHRIDVNYHTNVPGVFYKDWTHANHVDYNPVTDQILLSVRNFNEVWIIDHSTGTQEAKGSTGGRWGKGGDLLYRWGNPMAYGQGTIEDRRFFAQHDAHWIPEGKPFAGQIMVFNNGVMRPDGSYATADVIKPVVDDNGDYVLLENGRFGPQEQTFILRGNPPTSLSSTVYSSAEFIENGNILFVEGVKGIISEITQEGNVVWQYINPIGLLGPTKQGTAPHLNNVFSAQRIPISSPALKNKLLSPYGPLEIDPVDIGCSIEMWPTTVGERDIERTDLNAFPNPFVNALTLNGTGATDYITVTNAFGNTVAEGTLVDGKLQLNLTSLPSGVYYVLSASGATIPVIKVQ